MNEPDGVDPLLLKPKESNPLVLLEVVVVVDGFGGPLGELELEYG